MYIDIKNKVMAAGIAAAMTFTTFTSAYGADENVIGISNKNYNLQDSLNAKNSAEYAKPILNVETAVDAVIANSDKLSLKDEEIKMYRKQMNLQDDVNDLYEKFDRPVYDYPYEKLQCSMYETEQSKEYLKDQLGNDITNKYNEMVLLEMKIAKAQDEIDVENKNLSSLKKKNEVGMATSTSITDMELKIKNLSDNKAAIEKQLSVKKDYFKVLTNIDLNQYSLDHSVNYQKFRINGSEDEYFASVIDDYLQYKDEMITITEDYMQDLKDDDVNKKPKDPDVSEPKTSDTKYYYVSSVSEDGTPVVSFNKDLYQKDMIEYYKTEGNYALDLYTYGQYIEGKYNLEESKVTLSDKKKSLRNGLKEGYSTLLDLENKIDTLNNQILAANNKLRQASNSVKVGMMTMNDYNNLVVQSEELDITLRNAVNQYNNLKESLQKPWIASSEK